MSKQIMTIEEIKICEKNILDAFANFCNQNNLKYYITYGTLLGAIRHKGFIPWDDDIDVNMVRDDYNKMIEILKNQNNLITPNIELKTPNCKDYQYTICKIIDNTTFVQEETQLKKYKTSVWIDVFPLDYIPDSNHAEKFVRKIIRMQKHYNYTIQKKYSGSDFIGFLKFNTLKIFLTPIYIFINQKIRINKLAQKYSNKKGNIVADLVGNIVSDLRITPSDLIQIDVPFENSTYKTFINYDKVLRDNFGDYMQLPPEEKRVLAHSLTAYKIQG